MKSKKILKIGGSLYISITPYIATELNLKAGDEIEQKLKKNQIVITKKGDK